MRLLRSALITSAVLSSALAACSSQPKDPGPQFGFEAARARFAANGPQPGQPLPPMTVRTLDGRTTSLDALRAGRPLVLITASLTCNVARRQQADFEALAKASGGDALFVTLYTIDAHPTEDVCPYTNAYTNEVWVPKDNVRDDVLVRQPTTDAERLTLAKRYRDSFVTHSAVVVDSIDNSAWNAIGNSPNLGVLVDRAGVIVARQGWFDADAMRELLAVHAKSMESERGAR